MTNRETEEAQKRKEEKAMQGWLASDEYKVYRKEQLEANASFAKLDFRMQNFLLTLKLKSILPSVCVPSFGASLTSTMRTHTLT